MPDFSPEVYASAYIPTVVVSMAGLEPDSLWWRICPDGRGEKLPVMVPKSAVVHTSEGQW